MRGAVKLQGIGKAGVILETCTVIKTFIRNFSRKYGRGRKQISACSKTPRLEKRA